MAAALFPLRRRSEKRARERAREGLYSTPNHPKFSQRANQNPSASQRLTEGSDSAARFVRAALSQLS
jgi:hypothetical protein